MTSFEVKKKVRKILDKIYDESCQLPENFGDEVLEDVTDYIMFNHYNTEECMKKKFIKEAMLWCYMCRMQ